MKKVLNNLPYKFKGIKLDLSIAYKDKIVLVAKP
jgi:hypothetical protein